MSARRAIATSAAFPAVLALAACAAPEKAPTPEQVSAPVEAAPESESGKALRELLATMGVRVLAAERRLEVSGWVNMQSGPIEVFACAPGGKTHESVVVLDCVPSGLHAGLLALGLLPGTPVARGADGSFRRPTGPEVEVRVSWRDGAVEKTSRAEDWVWDQKHEQPMRPGAWIFAGSFLQEASAEAASAGYAADYVKSLVTTYQDATSILENPCDEASDDSVYVTNERAVPPVGTPVTVSFCPAAPSDRDAAPAGGG